MNNILLIKLLGITLIGLPVYYLLPRRLQNYWLLVLSYVFYVTWSVYFGAAALLLTLSNFVLGQELEKAEKSARGWLLALAIGANVASLLILKYPGAIFIDPLKGPIERTLAILALPSVDLAYILLLPLGYSYLILQMIAYQVDIYRSQTEASTDLVDFAVYVIYFPKLIAGPIEYARNFLPRLAASRSVSAQDIYSGTLIILFGLYRKLFIADPILTFMPDGIFSIPRSYPGPQLVLWLIGYSFAIYNDFAGYTGIVRGISRLFGIELVPNFRQPYFARNISDFWNRWHISFSHWLRDYIFFPVSRALATRFSDRRHLLNIILSPLVTMLISGMWHLIAPHLLLWGVIHSLYQGLERATNLWKKPGGLERRGRFRRVLSSLGIFVLVTFTWLPFRLPLPLVREYVASLSVNWSLPSTLPDPRLIFVILCSLVLDFLQERGGEEAILRWRLLPRALTFTVLVVVILFSLGAAAAPVPFTYQGF